MVAVSVIQTVKFCASLAACYLFISPMQEIRRVIATESIGTMQLLPLLSMFANCACWTLYGVIAHAIFPVAATNAIGLAFSTFYCIVYYKCTPPVHQPSVLKQMVGVLCAILTLILYPATSSDPHSVVQSRIGYVSIAVCTIMFASPLAVVKKVIQTKNAELLPFGMIIAGFVNSLFWLSYGFIIDDMFVIAPNFVNLALGSIQLILICLYPKPKGYDPVSSTGLSAIESKL